MFPPNTSRTRRTGAHEAWRAGLEEQTASGFSASLAGQGDHIWVSENGPQSPRMRKALKAAAIVALAIVSACASVHVPPRLPPSVQNSLGLIGVVTAGPPVGGSIDAPIGVGRQATIGVLTGAVI